MKIPVYEEQVRDSTALPGYQQNVRVTPDDYGAGLGEGIQRAAVGLGDAVRKYRAEQDTVVQQDAWSQLSEHGRQLLDDPTNGFKRQVGKDAMANRESVVTDFDAKVKQLSGGMSGDAQRVFLQNAGRLRSNFMDEVDDHTAKQIAVNDEQVHQATVSSAGNNVTAVGLSFDDPSLASKAMALGLNSAMHAVETKGQRLGWSPEVIDAEKKKTATELYASTIDAMLEAGQAEKAKTALGDFVASGMADAGILAQKNTQKNVDAGALRGEGQQLAAEVWQASLPKNDKGEPTSVYGDPAAAEADLRSRDIKDPALFAEALKNIKDRGSSETAARRESDAPLLGVIEQGIYSPGGISFNPASSHEFQKLSDEGKATALRILSAERRSLRGASNEDRRIQSEADRNAAADFANRAANDAGSAIGLDLRATYPDASKRQRDLLGADQGNLKKHQGVEFSSIMAQATNVATNIGLQDKAGFVSYIKQQYYTYADDPKNSGRKMPPADTVRGWIGDALRQGEDAEGTLWHTNMRAYEAANLGHGFTSDAGFDDTNADEQKVVNGTLDGQTPVPKKPVPSGYQRLLFSDGSAHDLPIDKVAEALARNPGSSVAK